MIRFRSLINLLTGKLPSIFVRCPLIVPMPYANRHGAELAHLLTGRILCSLFASSVPPSHAGPKQSHPQWHQQIPIPIPSPSPLHLLHNNLALQDFTLHLPQGPPSAAEKKFVVTGGGTGIGRAIAVAFAQAGASSVSILGRRLDRLQSAVGAFTAAATDPNTKTLVTSLTKRPREIIQPGRAIQDGNERRISV